LPTREELFAPKGVKPQWEMVYDIFKPLAEDDVLTYEEARVKLGWDLRQNRTPLYKAMRKMEQDDHRTLAPVPGVGYRIAHPTEHETLGRKHHRKARRQLHRSVSKFRSADRTKIPKEQADRLDRLEMTTQRIDESVRKLDERQKHIERVVKEHREEALESITDVNERVEKMREALRRHNIDIEI
jgi:hypothetical protein